jgi:predicted DNA-binding transcriptional regulator AlpA
MSVVAAPTPSLRLYCARELCQQFGISRASLDHWVKTGLFPSPLRPGGGKRFWTEAQVRGFLKSQEALS